MDSDTQTKVWTPTNKNEVYQLLRDGKLTIAFDTNVVFRSPNFSLGAQTKVIPRSNAPALERRSDAPASPYQMTLMALSRRIHYEHQNNLNLFYPDFIAGAQH